MQRKINRKVALGAAALVLVLGGTGAAVAATQSSGRSGRQAYLDSVAKHLGVSPGALSAAIRAADTERVEAALAAGRLTPAQAQRIKERLQRDGGAPFFGPRLGHDGRRGGGLLKVAAEYLGVSTATLNSERRGGRSLAQIAASTPGKSAAGLKDALVKAITSRLTAATGSQRISPQTEQRRASLVEHRVEVLLARTGSRRRDAGAPGAR